MRRSLPPRPSRRADDLAQYGLEEPECTITVTADTETVISVGSETSLDGLRYVSIGDGSVYLVDSGIYSSFCYGLYDLGAKEAIPDMSDLVSFTAERASGTLAIDYLEDSGLAYSDLLHLFCRRRRRVHGARLHARGRLRLADNWPHLGRVRGLQGRAQGPR